MICRLCGSTEGIASKGRFRCSNCGAITWLKPEKITDELAREMLSKPPWGVGTYQDREHR